MSKEDIYSTIPEEHIEEMPEELKDKLSNHLESYKGTFFKAMPLAKAIGYPTKGTQVELRKAITELIEEQKLPIVSNPKGFTWATCSNMIKFYLEALQHRKQGLERRIKSVNQIYHEMLEQEKKGEKSHIHLAYFGSELACPICNPNCYKNHEFKNPNKLKSCGHTKCPIKEKCIKQ